MFFQNLFENLALQLLFCVGIISVLGLVIWQLNRALFKILGWKKGRRIFLSTGYMGVPVHEFGHAFFCVIFLHKIVEVKWFQPNSKDGTLGYVRHKYNKKNFYHQIGNFFISIGPLLFGSLAIIILMFLLVPNSGIVAHASKVRLSGESGFLPIITDYGNVLGKVFLAVFDYHNLINFPWWIFIVAACSIAMHMDLSWADIKGMIRGLIYIVVIMLVLNAILVLVYVKASRAITRGCLWLSVSVVSFMALAVLLLGMLVLTCLIIKTINGRVKKRLGISGGKPVTGASTTAPAVAERRGM